MGIQYEDEPDLQRKIIRILNKQGFNFKKVAQICDLVDKVRKIYVEVKPSSLASAQILYGIARAERAENTALNINKILIGLTVFAIIAGIIARI